MTSELRARAIADTTAALDWFTIPHTVGRIIGIYAEATREHQRPMRPGLSTDELLSRLTSRTDGGGGGKSGHSDPTARDALHGMQDSRDDADETLRSIDAALELIIGTCVEINEIVAQAIDREPWNPLKPASRDGRLGVARSSLHRTAPLLEQAVAAGCDENHLTFLLRSSLCDTAEWLQGKCEAIWKAHRGDTQQVAVQKKLVPCRICWGWPGRAEAWAVQNERCTECQTFFGNHKCERTEAIVRRAEYGQGPTPGQMAEARASRPNRKRTAAN